MIMAQIGTLIDPKKKAEILQRIKDRKAPFCAEKPAPETPESKDDFYWNIVLKLPKNVFLTPITS